MYIFHNSLNDNWVNMKLLLLLTFTLVKSNADLETNDFHQNLTELKVSNDWKTIQKIAVKKYKLAAVSSPSDNNHFPTDIFKLDPVQNSYDVRMSSIIGSATYLDIGCIKTLPKASPTLFRYKIQKTNNNSLEISFFRLLCGDGISSKIFNETASGIDIIIPNKDYWFLIGWTIAEAKTYQFGYELFTKLNFTKFSDILRTYEMIENELVKPKNGKIESSQVLMSKLETGTPDDDKCEAKYRYMCFEDINLEEEVNFKIVESVVAIILLLFLVAIALVVHCVC